MWSGVISESFHVTVQMHVCIEGKVFWNTAGNIWHLEKNEQLYKSTVTVTPAIIIKNNIPSSIQLKAVVYMIVFVVSQ